MVWAPRQRRRACADRSHGRTRQTKTLKVYRSLQFKSDLLVYRIRIECDGVRCTWAAHQSPCRFSTHLIQLAMVDLSCLGWHNLMAMVTAHVLWWCDQDRGWDLPNGPKYRYDGQGRSNAPSVCQEGHRGCCSRKGIHPNRHTVIWKKINLVETWEIAPKATIYPILSIIPQFMHA